MKSLHLFLLCIPILSAAQAQEKYNTETIYLSGAHYVKAGERHPTGLLYGKLRTELSDSREAMVAFREYERSRNTAVALSAAALAATVAAFLIPQQDIQSGLLYGAAGLVVLSVPLSIHAQKRLHASIWLHNRDVLY
jgi:hypothetical protein